MRSNIGIDWGIGIVGAIEQEVRVSYRSDLRHWPLLQSYIIEPYVIGDDWLIIILKDKLSGIPSGSAPKPFPFDQHPPLPVTTDNVELWQGYLLNVFNLRPEDAAMILPLRDSGKSGALNDFYLFNSEEQHLWELQLQLIIARHRTILPSSQISSPQSPTTITYNVTGDNARVNVNSTDNSVNVVRAEVPAVFADLVAAIRGVSADQEHIERLEQAVIDMRDSYSTPGFGQKYLSFISILSDHIQVFGTVVAPFLPALAELATKLGG